MIGVVLTLVGISKLIYDAVKEEQTAKGRLTSTVKYISGNVFPNIERKDYQRNTYEKQDDYYEE